MPRVLTCTEFDATTQTCVQQAWGEVTGWPALPTLAQSTQIGAVMLGGLLIIRAMIVLCQPPKGVFNDP